MFSVKANPSKSLRPAQSDIHIAVNKADVPGLQRLINDGVDVNERDSEGKTPLHCAALSGNMDAVKILLENGADVTQVTDHGDTALHLASSKGHKEAVNVLLQRIDCEKIKGFVNTKSFYSGATALHLAAKRGSLDVLKLLLKHGASYNTGNVEDDLAVNLTSNKEVADLLQLIDELFEGVVNGNTMIVEKLEVLEPGDLLVALNCRNNLEHTLLQTAITMKQKEVADQILQILKKLNGNEKTPEPKSELKTLGSLISYAERHFEFSRMYLRMLRNMSQVNQMENNSWPWKTLKEGSYYLGNAFDVIEAYKKYVPGPIDDKDIRKVNNTLVDLGFNRHHISSGYTDEAYGGKAECFVSKGQGTKYYNLLHSSLKSDVRAFLKMVEHNIDQPLRNFVQSAQHKMKGYKRKILKQASVAHIQSSSVYIPLLRSLAGSEKNASPWQSLKEGSYYMANAAKFISTYKECEPGTIVNEDITLINNTLMELEFDPKHISSGFTDEAYGGEVQCFVSQGQGSKYYNMLHSEWAKDVRSFIAMAEQYIDAPVVRFLASLDHNQVA